MSFRDFSFTQSVIFDALDAIGYKDPTPIQQKAIPLALLRRDVVGIAQTGTGKTASFCLPLFDILMQGRARAGMPRALILEPTRELAAQVAESLQSYAPFTKLRHTLVIGGVSSLRQSQDLKRGVDIIVATPGRLLDQWEQGKLLPMDLRFLVIDEADRMLDMGFIPAIESICNILPQNRQTLLFSATLSKEIEALAQRFLNHPERVAVTPSASTVDAITQVCIKTRTRSKLRDVVHFLRETLKDESSDESTIIFCNRKADIDALARGLRRENITCGVLHGDLTQGVRTKTLEAFRSGEINLLIASDVASRGLDVEHVACVINFDVPSNAEEYIHRIGRTGRAGRSGKAFMFVLEEDEVDKKRLQAIEALTNFKIPMAPLSQLEKKKNDTSAQEGEIEKPQGTSSGARSRPSSKKSSRAPRATHSSDAKTSDSIKSFTPKPSQEKPTRKRGAVNARSAEEVAGKDTRKTSTPRTSTQKSPTSKDLAEEEKASLEPVLGFGAYVPAFMTTKKNSNTES